MRNVPLLLLLCVSLFLLLQVSCTTDVAGGSSGTEVSAIVGTALSENGTPVSNAKVRLRPKTFLSDSARSESYCATHSLFDTITGSDGSFGFSNVLPDSYTIEIVLDDTLGSELSCNIENEHQKSRLAPTYMVPMAKLSGSAQIYYGNYANISVQVYGLDRMVNVDESGYFTFYVPHGIHTFHIAAYQPSDSSRTQPFDEVDISYTMLPGEERDAGTLQLRSPPPPPCEDGTCDSLVIEMILNVSGNSKTPLSDIIKTDSSTGRIVSVDVHGLNFSMGMPYDITRLSALRELDVSHTRLPVMFPGIANLTNLEVARFSDNHLPLFSTSIGSLEHLRELYLDSNELTMLPPSLLTCKELATLSVQGNKLCYVDPQTASRLTNFDSTWQSTQRCP